MSAVVERKEEQIPKLIYFNPKPSVPAKKRGVTKSKQKRKPVSYTHLTLPTKRIV